MNTLPRNSLSVLAASVLLAVAAPSSFASGAPDVAAMVYAGGEALSPDAEMRLRSLMRDAAGGAQTRDDVKLDLALAREAGLLAAGGEMADTPRVLQARADFNRHQTRQILAAQEAAQETERQRVAAVEAVARARQMAEAAAQASGTRTEIAAVEVPADRPSGAMGAASIAEPAAEAPATASPTQPTERPNDRPADLPADRPVVAPAEGPVSRPQDLPVETLIDPD